MGYLKLGASADGGPRASRRGLGSRFLALTIFVIGLTALGALGQEPFTFQVVTEAAHDTDAFTQGYEIRGDYLYESVGLYGRSALRKIRLSDGNEVQRIEIPPQYFAEGLTILDDRLYQLTWREQTAFVYRLETLESIQTLFYSGEGWGLTNDGSRLYHSDGTSTIRVRTPDTFDVVQEIHVTENGAPIDDLNELEWVDGAIWANIWFSNRIVVIDPKTGDVTGSLDLTPIASRHTNRFLGNVLNGIAAHPKDDTYWITGKRWPQRYQLRVTPFTNAKPVPQLKGTLNSEGEAALCFPTYNQLIYRLEIRPRLSASTPWRASGLAHVGDGFTGALTTQLSGAPTTYFRLRVD